MTTRQPHPQPKECYDGTLCIDGKSDACNICYIPLQKGEKVSCKLHTICRYCVNDCFNYNPDYKCDYDTRTASHSSTPAPEVCEEQDACRIPAMCPEVTLARKAERERVLDAVLCDLAGRSCIIGLALEKIERERGKGWLREELLQSLRGGEQE